MREFETTFVVQPEISEEGIQTLRAKLDGILERHGAVRLMCDDLGRKRLAYEIRKFQKGHYHQLIYLDKGTVVPEIERSLRLDDSVLRFLTVQVSKHVEDIEKRKTDAKALEEDRARKAAERAAREAEDAARVAEEGSDLDRDRDRDVDRDPHPDRDRDREDDAVEDEEE